MTLLVSIYKTNKKEGLYLYVAKDQGLKNMPQKLQQTFGTMIHVMDLLLTPERKLARAAVENVISQIKTHGYYLQLPPEPYEISSPADSSSKRSTQLNYSASTKPHLCKKSVACPE